MCKKLTEKMNVLRYLNHPTQSLILSDNIISDNIRFKKNRSIDHQIKKKNFKCMEQTLKKLLDT